MVSERKKPQILEGYPEMSDHYSSPDLMTRKGFFSLFGYGCVCVYMWLALDQTNLEECSLYQEDEIAEYEKDNLGYLVTDRL